MMECLIGDCIQSTLRIISPLLALRTYKSHCLLLRIALFEPILLSCGPATLMISTLHIKRIQITPFAMLRRLVHLYAGHN
jgi:hypothetical protein